MYSKTNVKLVAVWIMSCRVTTLACRSAFKSDASRIAVKGVPSSAFNAISFKATSCPVCLPKLSKSSLKQFFLKQKACLCKQRDKISLALSSYLTNKLPGQSNLARLLNQFGCNSFISYKSLITEKLLRIWQHINPFLTTFTNGYNLMSHLSVS